MKRANAIRTIAIALTVVLVAVSFSGSAAAQTADGGQVGVCVIGVDSPCNGEEWDGDAWDGSVDLPDDSGDIPSDELPSDGFEVPDGMPAP